MYLLLLLLFSFILNSTPSMPGFQPNVVTFMERPDSIAQAIPDSITRDPVLFAGYLKSVCRSDEELAKTLYIWLGTKIYYDLDLTEKPWVSMSKNELIKQTLITRRGVCEHYAEVFTSLLTRAGIEAVTVEGYVRRFGKIDTTVGHAWNAARISGTWRLFDATWGSGYVRFERFHKRFTMTYYMTDPDSMIVTHIPFDPMWQLVDYPVTHDGFLAGHAKGSIFMNFTDSITDYFSQTAYVQTEHTRQRCRSYHLDIPELGTLSKRFFFHLSVIQREYNFNTYIQSLDCYSDLVNDYNDYVVKVNAGKLSGNTSAKRVAEVQDKLTKCKRCFDQIKWPDSTLLGNYETLRANLDRWGREVLTKLKTQ